MRVRSIAAACLVGCTICVAALFGFVFSSSAQNASTGALTGTVTDPSGGVIAGATITLVNNATGQSQTTTTSSNGTYRFSLLSPGDYSIKFSAQGFKTSQVPSVTVNVTEVPVQDLK